jgi:quercetin dioxygenase-like cupin family protein
MATSASGAVESGAVQVNDKGTRQAEAPEMLAGEALTWGPVPDVFAEGAQLCVLHGDPGAAGAICSLRLKASQAYLIAPHSHPHDEHVTVISGRVEVGNGPTVERSSMRMLEPGAYAFLPKEQFHYLIVGAEDTVIQVQLVGPFAITYANPNDDPRTAPSPRSAS